MSATETITTSQKAAADVSALLRARTPLIWIKSAEEQRVEGYLFEAAANASYEIRFWDVGAGVTTLDGKVENAQLADIGAIFATIQGRATSGVPGKKESRTVWVLRDPAIWLQGFPGASPLRQLRNLAKFLPTTDGTKSQAIIVLSAAGDIPPELSAQTSVIDWPLPDRAEIGAIHDAALQVLGDELREKALAEGNREAAIDAAIGLTGDEAASCYAKSLVLAKKIDISIVNTEKKSVVSREKVLEWVDPVKGGLDAIGGLDVLKGWLVERELAYSPAARGYGLPAPKGAFLFGISGCGKSLTAKCIATAWGVPLLKLDLGALKGKFVGESEGNIRKAFKIVEAIGRCVLWIDEIEKGLSGATQGAADGGVSADALGSLLTWMQERKSEAFVIATANDPTSLPPEMLRKGRWDEVFFVDLPTVAERSQIVSATLKTFGRQNLKIGLGEIADATADFTGAEIAELIPAAMFKAFADGAREIDTADVLAAADKVVPLAKTAEAKIKALRDWADVNARKATSKELERTGIIKPRGRRIEVDAA